MLFTQSVHEAASHQHPRHPLPGVMRDRVWENTQLRQPGAETLELHGVAVGHLSRRCAWLPSWCFEAGARRYVKADATSSGSLVSRGKQGSSSRAPGLASARVQVLELSPSLARGQRLHFTCKGGQGPAPTQRAHAQTRAAADAASVRTAREGPPDMRWLKCE